jgi:hypothetical protein
MQRDSIACAQHSSLINESINQSMCAGTAVTLGSTRRWSILSTTCLPTRARGRTGSPQRRKQGARSCSTLLCQVCVRVCACACVCVCVCVQHLVVMSNGVRPRVRASALCTVSIMPQHGTRNDHSEVLRTYELTPIILNDSHRLAVRMPHRNH